MEQLAPVRGKRKRRKGVVVKNKMDKTAVVRVERVMRHPVYGKVMRTHKKYYVHDKENMAQEGDIVEIMECRSQSKTKKWRLVRILKSQIESAEPEEFDDTDADQA